MYVYVCNSKNVPEAPHSSAESYHEIKRANSSSDLDSQIVSTETFADGRNSDARAERETRAAPFLGCRLQIYAPAEKTGKERKREVIAPGKSRESQILPSRETTSGRRETSLITTGFGIEFHPPSRGEYLLPRRVPHV